MCGHLERENIFDHVVSDFLSNRRFHSSISSAQGRDYGLESRVECNLGIVHGHASSMFGVRPRKRLGQASSMNRSVRFIIEAYWIQPSVPGEFFPRRSIGRITSTIYIAGSQYSSSLNSRYNSYESNNIHRAKSDQDNKGCIEFAEIPSLWRTKVAATTRTRVRKKDPRRLERIAIFVCLAENEISTLGRVSASQTQTAFGVT